MTTSADVTFTVRPPADFALIEGPEEWLEAYRYTRDLPSLLGLLHGGAQFTDDPRVLKVYLEYSSLDEERTDTVEFQVKKKARSIFYHEILRRFHCPGYPTSWHYAEARNFCIERAESLSRIFSFFNNSRSFPIDNPFMGDVGNFMYGYASYLPKLILDAQCKVGGIPVGDILQDPMYETLHRLVRALTAAITPFRWGGQLGSCEGGDIGYYEALIRKVAEHEFARELVRSTLRKGLAESLGIAGNIWPRDVSWIIGIEHGGTARRQALLLYDINEIEKLKA